MSRPPLHNAAFTMAGQIGARLLALAYYSALARLLGQDRLGDQGFGMSVGTLFVALLEPGLNQLLIRDGARNKQVLQQRLSEALGYKLTLFMVVWPLSWAVTWMLGYRGHALDAALWAGGTVLVGALEDVCSAALTAIERLDLEGLLRTLSKVFSAGLGLGVIAMGGSFAQTLAATWLGVAITGVVGLLLVRKAGIHIKLSLDATGALKQLVAEWPVCVSVVFWLFTLRLDQLVASLLGVSHGELGNYHAAVKIVEALLLFPNAIAIAFAPVISRTWQQGREACSRELNAAYLSSLSLTVAIALGGACVSKPLSVLVCGDQFTQTPTLLALQLLALPLVGLQFLAMQTLVSAGAVRAQAIGVTTNMLVNVACNLVLVPRLGVLGATLSALAGGLAAVIQFNHCVRRLGLRPGLLSAGWRPLLSGLVMVGVLTWVGDAWSLFPKVALGGLVYAAMLWTVGGAKALRALAAAKRGQETSE